MYVVVGAESYTWHCSQEWCPPRRLAKGKKSWLGKKGEKLLPCSRVSPFLQLSSFPFLARRLCRHSKQPLALYTNATAVTSNPQLFAMSTVANLTFLSCNYRVMGHNLRPSRGCEFALWIYVPMLDWDYLNGLFYWPGGFGFLSSKEYIA